MAFRLLRSPKKGTSEKINNTKIRNILVGLLSATAIILCIIAVATSHSDRTPQCDPPFNIARFRGIGIAAGTPFSRILAYRHDVNPLVVDPDPLYVMQRLYEGNITKTVKATSLVWTWLQFIGQDLSKTEPSGEPGDNLVFQNLSRDQYTLDIHGNRQQVNWASPFIDISQIYGNTDEEATS